MALIEFSLSPELNRAQISLKARMGLARTLNESRLNPNGISSESDWIPSKPDRIPMESCSKADRIELEF